MKTDAIDPKHADDVLRSAQRIDAFAPAHAPMAMPQQVLEASWFGRGAGAILPQAVPVRR